MGSLTTLKCASIKPTEQMNRPLARQPSHFENEADTMTALEKEKQFLFCYPRSVSQHSHNAQPAKMSRVTISKL